MGILPMCGMAILAMFPRGVPPLEIETKGRAGTARRHMGETPMPRMAGTAMTQPVGFFRAFAVCWTSVVAPGRGRWMDRLTERDGR
jgi:hypothetical protein